MRRLAVIAALAVLPLTAVCAPAAAVVAPHATRQVCAQTLYVREKPQGVVVGTLYQGDNFDVQRTSPSGQYTYGHAYGDVHQDGWVQSGHFC